MSPEVHAVMDWLKGEGFDCHAGLRACKTHLGEFYVYSALRQERFVNGEYGRVVFYVRLGHDAVLTVSTKRGGVSKMMDFDLADPTCFDQVRDCMSYPEVKYW